MWPAPRTDRQFTCNHRWTQHHSRSPSYQQTVAMETTVYLVVMLMTRGILMFPADNMPIYQIESPLDRDWNYVDSSNDYLLKEPLIARVYDSPSVETVLTNDDEEPSSPEDFPLGVPDEERNVPGEPLTPQDFQNAEKLDLLVPPQDENSPDPLEVAGLFEGDIAGVNASDIIKERNAIKNLHKRWYRGVVPYVISASFNIYERSVIAAAFLDYHRGTCVRFIPRTTQQDYVYLLKGAGCSSQVGRSGMGQQISLGPGCVYKGIVVHELMHAVGFWHEQSRADREDYVAVLWQNIKRGAEHNFQKYSWNIVQTLGMPYDTGSIMHYGMRAFSKDGHSPTIVPRQHEVQIGQRKGFSKIDLRKVNILYECKNVDVTNPRPPQPIPTKPSICTDNNRFCRYWARIGECQKNPTWMLVNCASSCNQCGRTCTNYNNLCSQWAALRECEKNPDYMVIFCPAACHTCNTGPAELDDCVDKNKYCAAWAKTGQCQANPNYMLHACRKSCQQC